MRWNRGLSVAPALEAFTSDDPRAGGLIGSGATARPHLPVHILTTARQVPAATVAEGTWPATVFWRGSKCSVEIGHIEIIVRASCLCRSPSANSGTERAIAGTLWSPSW